MTGLIRIENISQRDYENLKSTFQQFGKIINMKIQERCCFIKYEDKISAKRESIVMNGDKFIKVIHCNTFYEDKEFPNV